MTRLTNKQLAEYAKRNPELGVKLPKRPKPGSTAASQIPNESHLELAMIEHIKRHGNDLPPYVREHVFHPDRLWRFDIAWLDWRVAIEINGGTKMLNGGRHNTDQDREKVAEAGALGWIVLQFSETQIANNPLWIIDVTRRALRSQGAPC